LFYAFNEAVLYSFLFLMLFPKPHGIINPSFRSSASPKGKTVAYIRISVKFNINPGSPHGIYTPLHGRRILLFRHVPRQW
jgi:hypothetical protein